MTHEKKHRIIGIIGVLFLATVLLLNVVIVNKTKPTSAVEVSADGTFTATGTGQGIDGPVVVQITADSSKIYSVEILQQNEVLLTNIRHKKAVEEARESIGMVLDSIRNGMTEDFFSMDLMNAYESLGKITGESVEDDLVEEIFSKFCLGK